MKQTLWDFMQQPRIRYAAPLLAVGGFALMAIMWVLRVPLAVGLVLAIGLGSMGVAGAVIEAVLRAMARARAPIVFRPREPYEFVRWSGGYLNLVTMQNARIVHNGNAVIVHTFGECETMLYDDDARDFIRLMDEIATPLNMAAPAEETE